MDLDGLIREVLNIAKDAGRRGASRYQDQRAFEREKFEAEKKFKLQDLLQKDAERKRLMEMASMQYGPGGTVDRELEVKRYGFDRDFDSKKYGVEQQYGLGGSTDRTNRNLYDIQRMQHGPEGSYLSAAKHQAEMQRQASIAAAREKAGAGYVESMVTMGKMTPDEAWRSFQQGVSMMDAQRKPSRDYWQNDQAGPPSLQSQALQQPSQQTSPQSLAPAMPNAAGLPKPRTSLKPSLYPPLLSSGGIPPQYGGKPSILDDYTQRYYQNTKRQPMFQKRNNTLNR